MNKLYIVGIGPGTKEYLIPAALKEIKRADCLIGARRALLPFEYLDKKNILLKGDFNQAISYAQKNRDKKKIVVLVSGDPGLYSFLSRLARVFKKEDYTVIPGISTLQLAFAKIGESWQDAKIISLHGRGMVGLAEEIKAADKVFLFTDTKITPEKITRYLLKKGIRRKRVIVFERLAYADERIVEADLETLSKMKGFGLCVLIIKK